MFARILPIIVIVATVNLSTLVPLDGGECVRNVKVGNEDICVVENGTFYLFERYEDKVILQEYPAFYSDKKIPLNTPIENSNGGYIGQVIGEYQNYYPIAPQEFNKMYCGRFNLTSLVEDRPIVFQKRI